VHPAQSNQFAAQVSHCIPKGIQQLHLLRIIAPRRSPKAMRCTNADVAGPVWPRTCQEKVNSKISSYGVYDSKLETPDRKPELVKHRVRSELAKGQITCFWFWTSRSLNEDAPAPARRAIYASRYTYLFQTVYHTFKTLTCKLTFRKIPAVLSSKPWHSATNPQTCLQSSSMRLLRLPLSAQVTVLQGF